MNILIVRACAVGDFVVNLPALRALQETNPAARFTFVGVPAVLQMYELGFDCPNFRLADRARNTIRNEIAASIATKSMARCRIFMLVVIADFPIAIGQKFLT